MTNARRPTLIVDGPNVLMRAVHAAERSFMHHEGEPTGPLLLAINMLSRTVRETNPARMVVCFDGGRSRFRTDISSAYKADRLDRPADEKGPFSQFKTFLTLSGIHHAEITGWEADDLIAAYVAAEPLGSPVKVFSGDKDMLQLVTDFVTQTRPTGVGDDDTWTPMRVLSEYGIPSRRFNEYLALVGDKTDGVSGVRGYGPKKSVALMKEHSTWDKVVEALPEEHQGVAEQCFALVDLKAIPKRLRGQGIYLTRSPHFAPGPEATKTALVAFLSSYGLNSITEKVLSDSLWEASP